MEFRAIKKGVVVFDLHYPHHNKVLWSNILEFVEDFKPDYFVFGGDNMNMDAVDHWKQEGNKKRPLEGKRLREDYLHFQYSILDELERILPKNCDKIFMRGNHCLNKNTDILTRDGWKNITEVSIEDSIAQFDDKGTISFVNPIRLVNSYSDTLIRIESNKTFQEVTPNHKVVVDGKKVLAKDLIGKGITEKQLRFFGEQRDIKSGFSLDEIRLLTWVVMDGTIVNHAKYSPNSKKIRIQFKLSYPKKIERLKELLESMDIPFTFSEATKSGVNRLQPYYIRIYGDSARKIYSLLGGEKKLPKEFRNMSREELNIFLDTLLETDGSLTDGFIHWTSIQKENVDVVQESCIKNNISFRYTLRNNKSGFKNGKPQYQSSINRGRICHHKVKISEIPYNDIAYCFTMPLGTLITRNSGRIAFTGNCEWVDRYIDSHPEVEGLLEIENNLNLKKWKDIPYGETYKVGKLYFHHGEYTSKYSAAKTVDIYNRSIAYGHGHTHQVYTKITPIDCEPHMATQIPCACNMNPDFMRNRPSAWLNGFGIFYIETDGTFNLYPVIAINGGFTAPNGLHY